MASVFGHAFASVAIGSSYPAGWRSGKFWILGIICAAIPDADVISFSFGIPYEHVLGHRGFTHSIAFALILGVLMTTLFYRNDLFSLKGVGYISFFFLATLSHSILDAMTDGGRGVAFFEPFENSRYFFPWRPIKVSPIGAERFFSAWGLRVIMSELIWIGVPCGIYMGAMRLIGNRRFRQK